MHRLHLGGAEAHELPAAFSQDEAHRPGELHRSPRPEVGRPSDVRVTGMRIENFRDIAPVITVPDGGASVSDFLHYQHSHLYVEETATDNVYNLFTKQNPVRYR